MQNILSQQNEARAYLMLIEALESFIDQQKTSLLEDETLYARVIDSQLVAESTDKNWIEICYLTYRITRKRIAFKVLQKVKLLLGILSCHTEEVEVFSNDNIQIKLIQRHKFIF